MLGEMVAMPSDRPSPRTAAPSTGELKAALEHVLSRRRKASVNVKTLRREPSAYSSSFATEHLDLTLGGGDQLELVFKDLSRGALLESARAAKPLFLHDPLREIGTYEQILARSALGTPVCHGAVVDAAAGRFWLFLERIRGVELYQTGNLAVWADVARWLGSMHDRFVDDVDQVATLPVPLLQFDADFFRLWADRAARFAPMSARGTVERVRARSDEITGRLAALPRTFIHGEFYASNVLVQTTPEGRVAPVDWEMAGIGTGLLDLAALTTGWGEPERASLESEYRNAHHAMMGLDAAAFSSALDCCRLELCLRWLGWAEQWSPPPEHTHDWAQEAGTLADRLGL